MASLIKDRWSVAKHPMVGMTAGQWWRLLRENRFEVDAVYWPRAFFISLISVANALHRHREERLFKKAIEQVQVTEPPLFILGYWRSGTTHLHNLLAQDSAQFNFPNTYQVINPHTFLTTEAFNTRLFHGDVPGKRDMDNMPVSFQTPQEDEFALLMMTTCSPYVASSFPRNEARYQRYLTFRDVPVAELAEWKKSFHWFLKKLTLRNPRPLLLKSPAHTARIRLLLEIFPGARFVHIHRHPYQVFQSSRYSIDTMAKHNFFQQPERADFDGRLLGTYNECYDAFFADCDLIPRGQFHEVSFDEVERDPMGTTRRIYEGLNLKGFDTFEPKLRGYVDSVAGYQKNKFPPLSAESKQKIYHAWRRSFDEWHYAHD